MKLQLRSHQIALGVLLQAVLAPFAQACNLQTSFAIVNGHGKN